MKAGGKGEKLKGESGNGRERRGETQERRRQEVYEERRQVKLSERNTAGYREKEG